jgi:CRP/FNR family transcriptional regulator
MPSYSILPAAKRRKGEPVRPCAACEIRELAVCGALESHELDDLVSILTSVACDLGDAIFYEDDPADHLFNVTTGAVRISKLLPDGRRQITGFLFPGDFLGLAYNENYTYSAEAVGPSTLCRFPRIDFERLLSEHPKMERRLLGMASNELATAQDQMLLLGRKTAREKLATFLLMLSTRAERRGHPANPIEVPMTRGDIADYLGLTIETVSRTFTELRRSGLIEARGTASIFIPDPEAVHDIAGD